MLASDKLKRKANINIIYPYIVTSLFLISAIILIIHHEFWRDEVKAWLIGSESANISEFIYNMRDSQGHPFLWSFILYLISHFIVNNLETMKLVSLLFGVINAFLIAKFSPFNKFIKTGIIFSYFIFYEYTIISRNYSIGVLSIFLFCLLFKNWEKNLLYLGLSLLLMMQGSLFSIMIAIAFFTYALFIFIIERKKLINTKKIFIILFIVIFILGIVLSYWQLGSQAFGFNTFSPTADNIFKKTSSEYLSSIYTVSEAVIRAFIPIPFFNINFWNSNFIVEKITGNLIYFKIIIAAILLLIPFFILRKKVLLLYTLGILFISSIPFLLYKGYTRHYGHYFILFFACLWISENYKENNLIKNNKKTLFGNTYIAILLIISFMVTSIAYYFEYKYDFSAGKSASNYLRKNYDLNKTEIVGYQDLAAEVIAGYLNKDIYYPQAKNSNKYKKLVSWNNRNWDPFSIDKVINESLQFIGENKLIIAVSDIDDNVREKLSKANYKELFNSNKKAIVEYENFSLFSFNEGITNIYRITSDNFKNYLTPLNDCNLKAVNKRIDIEVFGDDPYFQVSIPFKFDTDEVILKINEFVANDNTEINFFIKYFGNNYNENDKKTINFYRSMGSVGVLIDNWSKVEAIRIDPTTENKNCSFESIEFVLLKSN